MIKVAMIQTSVAADYQQNQDQLITKIKQAAADGAQLVILPELHNTPYFCLVEDPDFFDLAETIPGPSTEVFGQLAAQLNIVLVCSLFEKRAAGLYHNTAVVFDKSAKIAGIYRKMHIPDDPGYYEKYYFTPGDLGFKPIATSVGKLGLLVCWDQWYPEAARLMCLAGAELLIYPTAIGWDAQDTKEQQQAQLASWQIIQRSHAVANGVPVLSCNRVGIETNGHSQQNFWGHSFICDAQGQLLADAQTCALILTAELDLKHSEQQRRIWPFLRDRRIDAYGNINQRYLDSSCP